MARSGRRLVPVAEEEAKATKATKATKAANARRGRKGSSRIRGSLTPRIGYVGGLAISLLGAILLFLGATGAFASEWAVSILWKEMISLQPNLGQRLPFRRCVGVSCAFRANRRDPRAKALAASHLC